MAAPAASLVCAHQRLPGPVQQQREGSKAPWKPGPHEPVFGDWAGAQAQGDR